MPSELLQRVQGEDRAVSPVIGVVLMIGIFAILMAAIGAFVVGFSPTQPPPDTEMAYVEDGASGVGLQVVMDVGDEVDAENVEFQLDDGTACDGWDGSGPIETGDETMILDCDGTDQLDPGDRVQAIWSDGTGSRSAVLDSYEVRGTVHFADLTCSDLESMDPVIIDDEVVSCEHLNVDTNIEVKNDGILVGNGTSAKDRIDITDGTIEGDADADGELDIVRSGVDEDVTAGDDVDLDDSTVGGDVSTGKVADVLENSRVDGDLTSTKVATVEESSVGGTVESEDEEVKVIDATVDDGVAAEDKVEIQSGSTVGGTVESRTGAVDVVGGSSVADDISADATVKLTDSSTDGDVVATGKATVTDSTVDGSVVSDTEVDLDGATIEGDVYVDSNFKCKDSTINGQDCDSYSPKDRSEY